MRSIAKAFLLLLTIAALYSCSTLRVTHDYDRSVDFTQLKTFEFYGWAEESDKILNPLERDRIQAAFADEFRKRGLTYVETGGDMIVTLFVMTENKTQYNATTTGMGYGGYYGYGPRWGWGPRYSVGMATTTVNEYNYTVGTLVIDIYDAAKEKLIFESIGSGTVNENPQEREKNIPKVAAKMMEPYPVAPLK